MHLWQNIVQCCSRSASAELKVMVIANVDPDSAPCCNRGHSDIKVVEISTDNMNPGSLDNFDDLDPFAPGYMLDSIGSCSKLPKLTPRQNILKEQLSLPRMPRYPVPLNCSEDDPDDVKTAELLRIFQAFVLDLHNGLCLTRVLETDAYLDVHCQLQDDLLTLKVDQLCGRMIEFPLTAVTKVYCFARSVHPCFEVASDPLGTKPSPSSEHIVVLEFARRKLALVFDEEEAHNFMMCIELLVCFALQEVIDEP